MYSRTWTLITTQLDTIERNVSKVDRRIKNSEMPSIPM